MPSGFSSSSLRGSTRVLWFNPDVTACIRHEIKCGANAGHQRCDNPTNWNTQAVQAALETGITSLQNATQVQYDSKPSSTYDQDCAFHLQTTGSNRGVISHVLSPGSPPLHRLPLGASVSKLSCLFVCFALSLCWRPCLRLSAQPAHKMFSPRLSFLCLSHANTPKNAFIFPSSSTAHPRPTHRQHWLAALMMQADSFIGCS